MNKQVIIRPETEADHRQIDQVIREAFGQPDESELVDRLRRTAGFVPELALVALVENNVVGHVLFSRMTIETSSGPVETLALAPVSVVPRHQRKGIGTQLIHAGIRSARDIGFQSVIVLGHADYYPAFGFRPTAEWQIKPPFDVPSENFMALELQENALVQTQGTVNYPSVFFEQ